MPNWRPKGKKNDAVLKPFISKYWNFYFSFHFYIFTSFWISFCSLWCRFKKHQWLQTVYFNLKTQKSSKFKFDVMILMLWCNNWLIRTQLRVEECFTKNNLKIDFSQLLKCVMAKTWQMINLKVFHKSTVKHSCKSMLCLGLNQLLKVLEFIIRFFKLFFSSIFKPQKILATLHFHNFVLSVRIEN